MKIKLKRTVMVWTICTVLILITSVFTANANELTLMGGGWSKHVGDASYIPLMNSNHKLKAVRYGDWSIGTFKNSYYKQSTAIAYNYDFTNHWLGKVNVRTSLALGITTGYDKTESDVMLTDKLSLFVLPTASISYQLTSDVALGLTIGAIPSKEATALTTNVFIRF